MTPNQSTAGSSESVPKPPVDPGAAITYLNESQQAFKRYQSQAKWIAYPVSIVVFFVLFFMLGPRLGTLGFIVAFFVAFAIDMALEVIILPSTIMPSVRCPFCFGAIPIGRNFGFLKPIKRPEKCLRCYRDLPH